MCKTFVIYEGKKYEVKKNFFKEDNFKSSCERCCMFKNLDGCGKCCIAGELECRDFDTEKYNAYFVEV